MLKSEINNETTRRAIGRAARKAGLKGKLVFEQGHWWFKTTDGNLYDVVDAEGPGTFNGFDFECVA